MWRLDEMNRINQTTRGPERKAALCELLEHESQLIASIGKHKAVAGKEHKSKAIQRFLDSVSEYRDHLLSGIKAYNNSSLAH